ncbi:hypothetical protein BDQ17DRAFT_1331718 [Cyathus striatus]|nr:hypothetical protein BDQ17DRAFT_1331718 [Cyathus striatus]
MLAQQFGDNSLLIRCTLNIAVTLATHVLTIDFYFKLHSWRKFRRNFVSNKGYHVGTALTLVNCENNFTSSNNGAMPQGLKTRFTGLLCNIHYLQISRTYGTSTNDIIPLSSSQNASSYSMSRYKLATVVT